MTKEDASYSNESRDFKNLYKSVKGYEFRIWTNTTDSIGFSLLKDYPEKGKYVPIKTPNGKHDSVVLIKIWYPKNEIDYSGRVILHFGVYKASRYKFDHHWYRDDDPNSPKNDSIQLSESSRQPIDLEDDRRFEYRMNNKLKMFFDHKLNKNVSPQEMVDTIYNLHLKTLTDIRFISLMRMQKNLIEIVQPINNILLKLNLVLFGKKIKETKEFNFKGHLQTYELADLEDATTTSNRLKILGSDFPTSPESARTFVSMIVIVFLVNIYFSYDILSLNSLLKHAGENSVILASFTTFVLIIIDRIIPKMVLVVINFFIRLRRRLTFVKISID